MPNVVKGSKQEKMVVVPHRPNRRLFIAIAAILGISVSAVGGFVYGNYQTLINQGAVATATQNLNNELAALQSENAELHRQVTILDRSSEMDRRATVEVQSTVGTLQGRVAQLEQDITYSRGVVSAETEGTGLVISQFDLDGIRESDLFRYKLVLRQQDADGDSYLEGHVNVNLVGQQGETQKVLALKDISEEQDQLDIRLRFKYFQNIEGELTLPEGFTPERFQIAAMSVEPVEKSINQNFSWAID